MDRYQKGLGYRRLTRIPALNRLSKESLGTIRCTKEYGGSGGWTVASQKSQRRGDGERD